MLHVVFILSSDSDHLLCTAEITVITVI